MREHWNDMPGDLADEDTSDLPGGFGADNPDRDPDALYGEVRGEPILGGASERGFTPLDQRGGDTAGTGYAEGTNTGFTVDPADLLTNEEAHPGAGVGFTGPEADKQAPSWAARTHETPEDQVEGGADTERETAQQERNRSVETEG